MNALSDVDNRSIPINETEVAQGEIASVTHIIVANANIAIIRRWITVKPFIPKDSSGIFHKINIIITAIANSIAFLILKLPSRVYLFSTAIFFGF